MQAEPGKQYVAIMHYWMWPPTQVEQFGYEQRECKVSRLFNHTTANSIGKTVTDLREIAEFVITLANSFVPIPTNQRIRLEIYELGNPILTA